MNEGYMSWDGTCKNRSCLSSLNPPQFGTRSGYPSAKSKALFVRILRHVAAVARADSSFTIPYSFHDSEKSVLMLLNNLIELRAAYSLQNLPPSWLQIGHSVSLVLASLVGILFCDWPRARQFLVYSIF